VDHIWSLLIDNVVQPLAKLLPPSSQVRPGRARRAPHHDRDVIDGHVGSIMQQYCVAFTVGKRPDSSPQVDAVINISDFVICER